jgi:hypothetical protein
MGAVTSLDQPAPRTSHTWGHFRVFRRRWAQAYLRQELGQAGLADLIDNEKPRRC